ncbi:MAG: DUF6067 family protein [Armatimonadota bacterium]|nr:DUF6067 family protein [Armatimonadota bacterium]
MRLRHLLTTLLVCACAVPALAFTRDEVLLYVPFDGSLQPTVAAGVAEPDVQEPAGGLGGFDYDEGVVGQAVRVGAEGTLLRYPTEGNVDPDEGTFSIWVQSIDWTLQDAPKVNRWWIDLPGPTRFIIYHYLHSSGIYFYHMDERGEHPSIIEAPGPWEPGEWKHLVGTWKHGRLRLYVNGEKVPEEAHVELGPIGEWIVLGNPDHNIGGEQKPDTNLDEFYVLSRALEDVEVRALYERGVLERRAELAIPTIEAPTVDGAIDEREYASAAAVTGLVNAVTGLLDSEQSVAWLGHDAERLYLAHRWPVPERVRRRPDDYSFGAFRKQASERDGALQDDDLVGIEVRAEDGTVRRIMANAAGTIGDWLDGDAAWDSGARVACLVDANDWVCEMAVPLADLGLSAGGEMELRVPRSHRLLREDRAVWPHPDAWADGTLATEAGAAQLTSLGRPWEGLLDLRLASPVTSAGASVRLNSGELERAQALEPGDALTVEQTLVDTSVTAMSVEATTGQRTLLAVSMPFTYPPMLEVAKFLYPSKDLLEVVLSTRGAASAAAARVQVLPEGGGEAVAGAEVAGGQGDVRTAQIDVGGLQPGAYNAVVTVGEGERPLGRQTLDFEIRERPQWLGNQVGIIDYVPQPWTALQYEGDTVSCWGRTVDLGGSLLPAQMVSQGEELLSSPVTLIAEVGGERHEPGEAQTQWGERTDQRGQWRATASIGPISAEVSGWIEFDGFMWLEVSLSAGETTAVDSLQLRVPMAKQHATLLYSGNYRTIDTGSTPADPWATSFVPCLGLSDEERGLQWCAQSRRGWSLEDIDRAIEVLPGEQATVLVANIIDTPTEIGPEPRVFAFGLHPAPVKPPLEGRRMLRPAGDMDKQPQPNLALWMTHWCLGCSYPLPVRDKSIEWLQARREQGVRTHAYTRLAQCSVKGPWYEYFRDEWRIDPGPRLDFNPEAEWGKANPVCQNSASWRDWMVWSLREGIEELGAAGIYYDVSRPALCVNHHHGCGYLNEDGEWEPETQILAARELQKRIWIMMHEELGCEISHHMSGHLWTATQSFSDMLIDGENFTSMVKDNYYELLPLDKFRAEFMGHQWGLTSIFLPEFSRAQLTPDMKELYESPEKLPVVRHLAGMIFLHDSIPWPSYSDLTPYHTIWAAQDELGWGDEVQFLPYWDNAQYLEPMGERLVASIFRKDGRALVVLFNNTDEPREARLRFDLQALGVEAPALRDFETGERFELQEGATTVPIGPRDFRLLMTW